MLSKLSGHDVHQSLMTLVQREKKITSEVVEHIAEVDRRRLYLEHGFTSLFQYLSSLGYSPASAQRRIDAARLHQQVPVCEAIQTGELNLTQISILAQGLRRKKVDAHEKSKIVDSIKNRDIRKTEVLVNQLLSIEPLAHDKKHFQKDESVRVEMTLTKEQWHLIQRVKEVTSHSDPNPNLASVIERLAVEFLKRRDPTSDRKLRGVKKADGVSAATRRAVFQRDRCCQWRQHKDSPTCGSRFQCQVDHIQSRWAGGTNDLSNLQLLCGVHNRQKFLLETKALCAPKRSTYSEWRYPNHQ